MSVTDLMAKVPRVTGAKGESGICIEFANELRRLTSTGEFNTVWFHVANEYDGKKNVVFGAVKKAEGKLAGVADYVFMWDGGCGAMEFKTEDGTLGENQKAFKAWCKDCGVPYRVARSKEDGLTILREWGRL